ncbi:MAG: hypothetical protein IJ604_14210 [Prevotella sp.]|nr:hypothetical protein [Prevotella sp.]MBR1464514.1 hypothetical protein [Prevotella sp.]
MKRITISLMLFSLLITCCTSCNSIKRGKVTGLIKGVAVKTIHDSIPIRMNVGVKIENRLNNNVILPIYDDLNPHFCSSIVASVNGKIIKPRMLLAKRWSDSCTLKPNESVNLILEIWDMDMLSIKGVDREDILTLLHQIEFHYERCEYDKAIVGREIEDIEFEIDKNPEVSFTNRDD